MPPAVEAQEHVKFLVTCIKHAKDGKIDFQAVADELNIVSRAAAGKRYERLLKAHDVGGTPSKPTPAADANGSVPATPNGKAKKDGTPSTGRKRARAPAAADGEVTPSKKPRSRAAKSKPSVKDYTSSDDDQEPESATKIVLKHDPDADKDKTGGEDGGKAEPKKKKAGNAEAKKKKASVQDGEPETPNKDAAKESNEEDAKPKVEDD